MKKCIGVSMLALLVVLAAGPALANDGNAATSASGQKGLYELIYGENLCHGQWAFSTYYNKWDRRVQSDPATLVIDPLWTDWDMDVERASLAIGYGITDKIELSIMLPYWSFDGEDIVGENRSKGILNGVLFDQGVIDQSGIGNIRVGAKFQLKRTDTYATALMAYVDAPTGDDDEAVVTGDPGLGLTYAYNNRAGWVFNLGYFDPGDSDFLDVSDEVRIGFGYAKDLSDDESGKTEWITELTGIVYTDSNGEHDSADLTSGGRWRLSNPEWAVNAALRVDLSDTSFDYSPIGGLVGLSYSPKNRFNLSVATEGDGTITGEKIDCGSTCEGKYHCGTTVELTAKAADGWRFAGWGGDCGGEQGTISVTLDTDKSCTAKFIELHDLTLEVVGEKHPEGGEILGGGLIKGGQSECKDKCTFTYDTGTKINLVAVANENSSFGGWSVDCSGTAPGASVTLDGDKTCVATFVGPPPPPCEPEMTTVEVDKCAVYVKKNEWSCDAATWTQLVEGYAKNSANVPSAYIPTDANEKKTPLCDVVNFLRMCSDVKACIAGSQASGEERCTAENRAARLASFFQAQSAYPAFEESKGRYSYEGCSDTPDPGMSAEIFFQK